MANRVDVCALLTDSWNKRRELYTFPDADDEGWRHSHKCKMRKASTVPEGLAPPPDRSAKVSDSEDDGEGDAGVEPARQKPRNENETAGSAAGIESTLRKKIGAEKVPKQSGSQDNDSDGDGVTRADIEAYKENQNATSDTDEDSEDEAASVHSGVACEEVVCGCQSPSTIAVGCDECATYYKACCVGMTSKEQQEGA